MRKIQYVLSVCVLVAGVVEAVVITRETPVAVPDETDVVTNGTLVEAINWCGRAITGNPVVHSGQFIDISDKLDNNTE